MLDGRRETLKEKKLKLHASYTASHFECHLGLTPKASLADFALK